MILESENILISYKKTYDIQKYVEPKNKRTMNFKFIFTRVLIAIILSSLFFVAGGGISQNGRWRVEQIRVEGTDESARNRLLLFTQEKLQGNYFLMYARENSYLFPEREIERDILKEFPRLKNAKIKRVDSHTLLVSVVEREHFALWCGVEFSPVDMLENCWSIDTTGFVFERAPTFSTGVYFEVYGVLERETEGTPLRAVLPRERFGFAISFIQKLQKENVSPLRIFIKHEGEYGMVVDSSEQYPMLRDAEILFKDGQDTDILIKNLLASLSVQFPEGSVLKKKLLYIDLRFGNKVFFGFEK